MLLETENLTKRFGELTAVNAVDLQIEAGDSLSIIGPNGAGKSTTVNLITGLLDPSEGSVRFRGEDITGKEPHQIVQRGLSKSFQTASIFPELTVKRNAVVAALGAEHSSFSLNFFKRLVGYSDVLDRAEETLRDMGLYEQRHIKAKSLPYGDKRRLEMALASNPDLLFLDETRAALPDAVAGIDGESAPEFCRTFDVEAAPSVLLFEDGELVESLRGYQRPEAIEEARTEVYDA